MSKKYIIIGGVAGGATVAARLRRLDEFAQIIMFEKGTHVSFSNCSLPYYLGGHVQPIEKLLLMTPEKFANQFNIDARINSEVTHIDQKNQIVTIYNHMTKQEYQESYDKLIVAVGAKPFIPNLLGLEQMPHFTLRNVVDVDKIHNFIFNQDKLVRDVSIIGAGFIGVEVAENLREKGFNVTLIEMNNQIMKTCDFEMAKFLEKELLDNGVNLLLSEKVVAFEANKVILESGKSVTTDVAILALGVIPDTLFLKDSGIKLAQSGHILVNQNYQTSDPNIYAAGDAIMVEHAITKQQFNLALAGPANKQARFIADHIYGKKVINKGYIGSSIIKIFNYTGASTGLTESWIKAYNLAIDYRVAYVVPVDRVGIMPDAKPIFIKIIYENNSGKLLGAQAVGSGLVDKRVDVLAVAIKAQMTVEDLQDLELCYAPPFATGKDAVNHAGYVATNLFNGDFKQVLFTEVKQLIANEAQIIDVRNPGETANGMLHGAINIPLPELRSRLNEIDKKRPVYLHCRTGQRSYNAALLLQQHGFDAYNIAGSYIMMSYYFDTLNRLTGEELPFNKANFA